jgi:hypothetical protein
MEWNKLLNVKSDQINLMNPKYVPKVLEVVISKSFKCLKGKNSIEFVSPTIGPNLGID